MIKKNNLKLSEEEITLINQMQEQFGFKNENPQEIQTILYKKMIECEEDIIKKFDLIHNDIIESANTMDECDANLKQFEQIINQHSSQFNQMHQSKLIIENHNDIIEQKMKNLNQIVDSINMNLNKALNLITGGVGLEKDEKNRLLSPNFSNKESINEIEVVLEKISCLMNACQDPNYQMSAYQDKLKEIELLLKQFLQSLLEHIDKFFNILNKDIKNLFIDIESFAVQSDDLRQKIISIKRILNILNTEIQNQVTQHIQGHIRQYFDSIRYNQSIIGQMKQKNIIFLNSLNESSIINKNFGFQTQTYDIESFEVIFDLTEKYFIDWVEEVLYQENFWSQIFSTQKQKLDKCHPEIIQFMKGCYDQSYSQFQQLFQQLSEKSIISIFILEISLIKHSESLQNKNSFSLELTQQLLEKLQLKKSQCVQQYEQIINSSQDKINSKELLKPTQQLINFYNLVYDIMYYLKFKSIYNTNTDLIKNLFSQYEGYLSQVLKKNPKVHDYIIIINYQHIEQNLSKKDLGSFKSIVQKSSELIQKSINNIVQNLLNEYFKDFMEFWNNLKQDKQVGEIKNDPRYTQKNLDKIATQAFSKFDQYVQKIIKKISEKTVDLHIRNTIFDSFKKQILNMYQELDKTYINLFKQNLVPEFYELKKILENPLNLK